MATEHVSFAPRQVELRCASFGPAYKAIVAGSMVALTVWGYRLLTVHGWEWTNPVMIFALTYAMLLYMTVVLLTGKTTLNQSELKQDWFWRKTSPVNGISYVRFFRINGWEWLIAPRLYVRAGAGPMRAYHAYGADMWREFDMWSESVKQTICKE